MLSAIFLVLPVWASEVPQSRCLHSNVFWSREGRHIHPIDDHARQIFDSVRKSGALKTKKKSATIVGQFWYGREDIIGKFYFFHKGPDRQAGNREADVIQRIQGHKNIVKFFFCVADDDYIAIFMEKLSMDLADGVYIVSSLSWVAKFDLMLGAISGLRAMHNLDIFHGDIKPDNIMFTNDHSLVKLIDFGFSVRMGARMSGITPLYAAPEKIEENNSRATSKKDVFSLGMTIVLVFFPEILEILQFTVEPNQILTIGREQRKAIAKYLDHVSSKCGLQFNILMKWWLHPNPSKRYTLNEAEEGLLSLRNQAQKSHVALPTHQSVHAHNVHHEESDPECSSTLACKQVLESQKKTWFKRKEDCLRAKVSSPRNFSESLSSPNDSPYESSTLWGCLSRRKHQQHRDARSQPLSS